ncbi:MAG: hypothetical protein H0U73_11990 [Tatlockia sp.]|nr:hypothetical protein [Tatlockia sp.]
MGFFSSFAPPLFKIPDELTTMSSQLMVECSSEKALAKEIHDLLDLLKKNNTTPDIVLNGAIIKEKGQSIIQRLDTLKVTESSYKDVLRLAAFIESVSNMHGNYHGTVFESDRITVQIPVLGEKTVNLKKIAQRFHEKIRAKIYEFENEYTKNVSSDYEPIGVSTSFDEPKISIPNVSSNDEVKTQSSSSSKEEIIKPLPSSINNEDEEKSEVIYSYKKKSLSSKISAKIDKFSVLLPNRKQIRLFNKELAKIKDSDLISSIINIAKLPTSQLGERFSAVFSSFDLGAMENKTDKKDHLSQSVSNANDVETKSKKTSRLKRAVSRSKSEKISVPEEKVASETTLQIPRSSAALNIPNQNVDYKTRLQEVKSQKEEQPLPQISEKPLTLLDIINLAQTIDSKKEDNSLLVDSPSENEIKPNKSIGKYQGTMFSHNEQADESNEHSNESNIRSKLSHEPSSSSSSEEGKNQSWEMPTWMLISCVIVIGPGTLVLIAYALCKLIMALCSPAADVDQVSTAKNM